MTIEKLLADASTDNVDAEHILDLNMRVRKSMLTETLKGGIPTGKQMYSTLKLLEDMDRSTLDKQKQVDDKDTADEDRRVALYIAALTNKVSPKEIFATGKEGVREVNIPAGDIPDVTLLPEEGSVGLSELTYDEFTKNVDV